MITALAAAVLLSIAPAVDAPPADNDPVVIRSALALTVQTPRSNSRSLIRRDAVEAQLVAGSFQAPTADANWLQVSANAEGVFTGGEGSALQGGWLYATVQSATDRVMILEASGHGSVFVNGDPRGGDPYSWGFVQLPVQLKAGSNSFLFSVGRGRFSARLLPAPAPAFICNRDLLVPSLIAGQTTTGPIGVVVVNASMQPLAGARIRIASDLKEDAAWVDLHVMPALTVKKVSLPANFAASSAGPAGSKQKFTITLADRRGAVLGTQAVELATISTTDRRVVTRLSTIDGSTQYYAVVPSTADRNEKDPMPGILFSVHGAGVDATGQAGCYAPKDEAHVVCPTNRRPFGFDWEDWGRIDFAEAAAHARANLVNDPRRSWLTGHSMGGHGTWQLGAHFPSEFAAIAPSAGWISFGSYVGATAAGSETPTDPAAAMLLRAGRASDTLAIKENYLSQGVYVLHGDADDNVPVSEAREMFKQLAAISHPDFEYYERPAAGHWWGNECVDWPPLMQFVFRHTLPDPKEIKHVSFKTVAPQVSQRSAWVRVLQQSKPYEVSAVDVQIDVAKQAITGTTSNVTTLDLSPTLATAANAPQNSARTLQITLDGDTITVPQIADTVTLRFHRAAGNAGKLVWSIDPACRNGGKPDAMPVDEKKPARGGPFKNAFVHGFVAVIGTQGDAAADALILAKARFDADQWWVRGNGRFEILTDTAFDPAQYKGRNVILYGNHQENGAWNKVLGDASKIDITNGSFIGPTARYTGDDIAAMFVMPRADCPQGQVGVIAATGAKGMRAAMRTPIFSAGVGVPDLIAFRASMLTEGAAGVIEAGFFGNDWGIDTGEWMRR